MFCTQNQLITEHAPVYPYEAVIYGKPDYQASATVISESHRVMAIADEAQTDGGRLEDPEHR